MNLDLDSPDDYTAPQAQSINPKRLRCFFRALTGSFVPVTSAMLSAKLIPSNYYSSILNTFHPPILGSHSNEIGDHPTSLPRIRISILDILSMNLNSELHPTSADQEREMTEAILSFAKYAIQNAQDHLNTVGLRDAVELLQQVERLIESRLIELSPPAEPGLVQPEANELDLRDL